MKKEDNVYIYNAVDQTRRAGGMKMSNNHFRDSVLFKGGVRKSGAEKNNDINRKLLYVHRSEYM